MSQDSSMQLAAQDFVNALGIQTHSDTANSLRQLSQSGVQRLRSDGRPLTYFIVRFLKGPREERPSALRSQS
ncbi:MAG: hypothetical protein JWO80_1289 [Bryobacterales bacterium]|nr:hypothetical protein [Bryobacterales bacterium]